ncbi:hypothetical protein EGW08_014249 [Elysia chlorotica]|uniref:Uncharacterized protein n=1 Tax=Elysia chlorotica TaxID=188477 RepID=A0A3S1B8Z9_ELYCH|nr:hypothetical protein EGW08_014249 [Elysia chlorotica]
MHRLQALPLMGLFIFTNTVTSRLLSVPPPLTPPEVKVPFYVRGKVPRRQRWLINSGLSRLLQETRLLRGRKLSVNSLFTSGLGSDGEKVTRVQPVVQVDGRTLPDSEVNSLLRRVAYKFSNFIKFPLFTGRVHTQFSPSQDNRQGKSSPKSLANPLYSPGSHDMEARADIGHLGWAGRDATSLCGDQLQPARPGDEGEGDAVNPNRHRYETVGWCERSPADTPDGREDSSPSLETRAQTEFSTGHRVNWDQRPNTTDGPGEWTGVPSELSPNLVVRQTVLQMAPIVRQVLRQESRSLEVRRQVKVTRGVATIRTSTPCLPRLAMEQAHCDLDKFTNFRYIDDLAPPVSGSN